MAINKYEKPEGRSLDEAKPSPSTKGISVKPSWRLLAIAASVAGLAGLCIASQQSQEPGKATTTVSPDRKGETSPATDTQKKSADVLDYSIMPTVEISRSEFVFARPQGFSPSREELFSAADRLNSYLVEQMGAAQEVLRNTATENQETVLNRLIENLYRYIQRDKVLAPFALEQSKSGEDSFQYQSRVIEKVLIHIGQYFKGQRVMSAQGKAMANVNMLPVAANETAKIKDKDGAYQLPVLTLAGTFNDNISGTYDADIDAATVRQGDMERIVVSGQKQMRDFKLLPAGFDAQKFRQEYIRDTKIHEATHAYIGKKFPKMGKVNNAKERININLNMIVNDQASFPISGSFHPINLQEMCAVGSELFNSEDDTMYSFMKYTLPGNGIGYELVNRVIIFYAIKRAPDSPQKRELEAQLASNQPINTMDVIRLIRDTYTRKQMKEVGFKLYDIGFDLLGQGENAAGGN